MTLQEAIDHALKKANQLGNCECANEHLQLAEWLKELQNIKAEKEAAYSPWRDPKKGIAKGRRNGFNPRIFSLGTSWAICQPCARVHVF